MCQALHNLGGHADVATLGNEVRRLRKEAGLDVPATFPVDLWWTLERSACTRQDAGNTSIWVLVEPERSGAA